MGMEVDWLATSPSLLHTDRSFYFSVVPRVCSCFCASRLSNWTVPGWTIPINVFAQWASNNLICSG